MTDDRKEKIVENVFRNDAYHLVELGAEKRAANGLKVTPKDVAVAFYKMKALYDAFREDNGLNHDIENIHEVCNAMTDKHGRICRQIKHFERDDAKDDWPEAVPEAFAGYFVYGMMVMNRYKDMDITEGFNAELHKGIQQHGKDE